MKAKDTQNQKISKMNFEDFYKTYGELAKYAMASEKKGKLDLHDSSYIPMTKEEEALHEKDWKEFSRKRGFNEEDIDKYAEWHKISGQEDKIDYALNDPWRRGVMSKDGFVNKDYAKYIYDEHLKNEKPSLEKTVAPAIFAIFTLAGLFFSTNQLTGNAIGISNPESGFYWLALFFVGLSGFFVTKKYKK